MRVLIFGMGYTARALVEAWPDDWPRNFVVTTRSREKAEALEREGFAARVFPGDDLGAEVAQIQQGGAQRRAVEGRERRRQRRLQLRAFAQQRRDIDLAGGADVLAAE